MRPMKNIRQAAAMKLRCPSCRLGGFKQRKSPIDGMPSFACTRCFHSWTAGKDGGLYALAAAMRSDQP